MGRILLGTSVALALGVAGVVTVRDWFRVPPPEDLEKRVPTEGERPPHYQVEFPGEFRRGEGAPSDLPGNWPGFRGPARDGVSREDAALARTWPEDGPKVVWSVEMGEGHGGAAVHNGRVYVLDYDMGAKADALRCLSLADGREIWRRWYEIPISVLHGISRTVPAVTGEHVVTLGPKCQVMCVDAETGEFRWARDLVAEFGTEEPKWYAGQCPLIDGGRAIIAPAGPSVMMLAIDCATGRDLWKTPNPYGWQMTHCSITPVEFDGVRMYVYPATGGVMAVAAENTEEYGAGEIVWIYEPWKVNFANVCSPIAMDDGKVFLPAGYKTGSLMLQMRRTDNGIAAEKLFEMRFNEFSAEQQTPIYHEGYVYGVMAKEAGRLRNQLVCMDPSGEIVWSSGRDERFGLGPFVIGDGMVLAMDDHGVLTAAEAKPEAYRQVARAEIFENGIDAWGPMALAGGRLIARDLTRMVCLDLRAGQTAGEVMPVEARTEGNDEP
jgi:outer membrane protein assembly factor BamB